MSRMTEPHADRQALPDRMPRSARIAVGAVLASLIGVALYLGAVRGEALLIDLAALGSRLWCF